MDELIAVARLRGDIPCDVDLAGPQRRLADEIATATAAVAAGRETPVMTERGPAPGPARGTLRTAGTRPAASPAPGTLRRPGTSRARDRRRRAGRGVVAATAALAVAAAVAVIVVARTGGTVPSAPGARTTTVPAASGNPRPVATAAELVAGATRVARATPDAAPNPLAWVYTKTEEATSASQAQNGTLLGPVTGTVDAPQWTRVDGREIGFLQDGKLNVSPGGGTPGSWQSISYSYFSSLPTDPAKLAALIDADNKTDNYVVGAGVLGIFNAVAALLGAPVVLPVKLRAALYAVLASEPGVDFEPHVTDIAGRTDVAFWIDQEGYDRSEVLINPATYSYMGEMDVAYAAHTFPASVNNGVASGPYTRVSAGQIMGEQALLQSGIVQQAGQVLP